VEKKYFEDVKWYFEKIHYYCSVIEQAKNSGGERFRLQGELEEYTILEGIKFQLRFWEEGLIEYVQSETKRQIEDKKRVLARGK